MRKKFSFIIVVVSLMAVVLGACAPQSTAKETIRSISVSGTGKVYLVPDIAYVYIGTRSEAVDVATALSDNNQQAQSISSVLSDMGVDSKDIQTTSFNVYPLQNYGPDGQPTETKYVVENTVFVKVRQLQKLGEMLDAVVRKGANQINGITFDVEDHTQAESDARKLAVQDATSKAKELADAAGVELGQLLNLSVYLSGSPQPMYDAKGGGYAVQSAAAPIASGQLVISADASLSYEIK